MPCWVNIADIPARQWQPRGIGAGNVCVTGAAFNIQRHRTSPVKRSQLPDRPFQRARHSAIVAPRFLAWFRQIGRHHCHAASCSGMPLLHPDTGTDVTERPYIGPLQAPLHQAPKGLGAVRVDVAIDVLGGAMIDHAVRVLVIESFELRRVSVKTLVPGSTCLWTRACKVSFVWSAIPSTFTRAAALEPVDDGLPTVPRPLMTSSRRFLCMKFALPPTKLSSDSTSPFIFANDFVFIAIRWSMNHASAAGHRAPCAAPSC